VEVADLERKHGSSHVARLVGVTETHVRHIANARRSVSDRLAGKFAEVFGVPVAAWKTPADAELGKASTPASAPPNASSPQPHGAVGPSPNAHRPARVTSAIADLEATVERLDAALLAVEADPVASPSHRAQLFNAKVNALEKLARLRGEGEISEAAIVRSQAFRRIMAVVFEAMRDHPAAATALRTALSRLREVGP
jgi:hypothetical protein